MIDAARFREYIGEIRKNLQQGNATEHTHRPALKALLLNSGVRVFHIDGSIT